MSNTRTGNAQGSAAPICMTVLSMSSVQLSDAFSVPLIASIGPAATAWMRMTLGALVLLALVRPRVRSLAARQWRAVGALGVASAALTVAFMSALEVLPLGTTVAIAFLGPLTVAVAHPRPGRVVWPMTALAGVGALTAPWSGGVTALGALFAAVAGASWAAYIILTRAIGDRVPGLDGLALAMPVAALCLAPWGAAQALPQLDGVLLLQGVGIAVLMPVLPYALELFALRRLAAGTFATLMSLEPVLACAVGVVVLGQHPSPLAAVGVALVVIAGVGATRSGAVDRSASHPVSAAVPWPAPALAG